MMLIKQIKNHRMKQMSTCMMSGFEAKRHTCQVFNTFRPRQNGRHFADGIFKHIFLNENARISSQCSLKFVPKGPINNIPTLVQIMVWRSSGDKLLSEPMMVRLPTHICGTRLHWVNAENRELSLYMKISGAASDDKNDIIWRPLSSSDYLVEICFSQQFSQQLLKVHVY